MEVLEVCLASIELHAAPFLHVTQDVTRYPSTFLSLMLRALDAHEPSQRNKDTLAKKAMHSETNASPAAIRAGAADGPGKPQ